MVFIIYNKIHTDKWGMYKDRIFSAFQNYSLGDVKMKNITILMAEEPTVVIGGADSNAADTKAESSNQIQTSVQTAQDNQAAQTTATAGKSQLGMIGMFIYIIVLIAVFYFFAIRPQKKREKEMKEMQAAIQVGDEVMTSSGFYGKVVEIGENDMIVEFGINRGVKIKVKKSEIIQASGKTQDSEK